jgi:2-dehydropantoate 2-reductase
MGNVAFNPISVLTGATMRQIAEHPRTRALVVAMMEETMELAARLGSRPQVSIARRLEGAAAVGDHKTSMLMDYEAGKQLELETLLRAPIELAQLIGLEVANLKAIDALIELLASRATSASP